jgi:agmatinase
MRLTLLFALGLGAFVPGSLSHRPDQTVFSGDFIDITTGSQFNGLGTFANLPYVNCLDTNQSEEGRYDMAILGAPFDTVSDMPAIIGRFSG